MSFPSYNDHYSNGEQKDRFSDSAHLTPSAPPPYVNGEEVKPHPYRSCFDPRGWSRQRLIFAGVGLIIVIVVIVVTPVIVNKANKYPAYLPLNYTLADTYSGSSFFDDFDYFVGYDPSQGFVHYVDQPGSVALNLTYATATSAILRVDNSELAASTGRKSVRVESKKQYNAGLFVFDVAHAPFGCGTWPALWLSDSTAWPQHGEIDIFEAVNTAVIGNQMTLHTTDHCSMKVKRKETGKSLKTNCYNGTDENAGCGVQGKPATSGADFNSAGGGVYAMEWRSDGIRIWFWSRTAIPLDISSGNALNPSSWGEAVADFPGTDCNIDTHFRNHSIIANIDLCGGWAGADKFYSQDAGCPGTCTDFVANNATAFVDAYWEFNSFKVYQTI